MQVVSLYNELIKGVKVKLTCSLYANLAHKRQASLGKIRYRSEADVKIVKWIEDSGQETFKWL